MTSRVIKVIKQIDLTITLTINDVRVGVVNVRLNGGWIIAFETVA